MRQPILDIHITTYDMGNMLGVDRSLRVPQENAQG